MTVHAVARLPLSPRARPCWTVCYNGVAKVTTQVSNACRLIWRLASVNVEVWMTHKIESLRLSIQRNDCFGVPKPRIRFFYGVEGACVSSGMANRIVRTSMSSGTPNEYCSSQYRSRSVQKESLATEGATFRAIPGEAVGLPTEIAEKAERLDCSRLCAGSKLPRICRTTKVSHT